LPTLHSTPPSYRPLSFVTEAIASRAEQYLREGQHVAAAWEYRALAELDDHDVRAAVRWASHAKRGADVERAADAWFAAAGAAVRAGDPRRALLLARHALALAPSRATRRRLEPLAHGCGPEGEALCTVAAGLHTAAGRDEIAVELHHLLAEMDAIAREQRMANVSAPTPGRTGEFVRVAEAMIARGRHDADTVLELARIYLRRGQPHEAIEKLELLRRVAPERIAAAELLMTALLVLDRTAAALGVLQDAARRRADAPEVIRDLFARAEAMSVDPEWTRLVRTLADRMLAPDRADASRPRGTPPPPPVWSLPRRVVATF